MTLRVSLHDTQRVLARPAQNSHQRWPERQACIITLESDDGARGWGEAAPLPGLSPDSLSECQSALSQLDPAGIPARLLPSQSALAELARASQKLPATLPAARAALEGALLDLWARSAGLPAWSLLLATPSVTPEPRQVAALLMAEPEQALAQAELARARGIQSFKFKIGRPGAAQRELFALSELRGALGGTAKLRLDANRSFSVAQARAYLPRFAEHDLELIEEPCHAGQLGPLLDLGIPLALDESLTEHSPDSSTLHALSVAPVCAVILKPTLLGGITPCVAWAHWATQHGLTPILSHAFEGPLGLALSAALALSIGSPRVAHGLDVAGASLDEQRLPFVSGAHIRPWTEPGFGLGEPPR